MFKLLPLMDKKILNLKFQSLIHNFYTIKCKPFRILTYCQEKLNAVNRAPKI